MYICIYIYIYIYIKAARGLHCCMGFSPVVVSRGYSSCGAWASHCGGSSVQSTGFRAYTLSSFSMWALSMPLLASRVHAQ